MGRLSPAGVQQAGPMPETIDRHADRCDAACPAEAQVHMVQYPDRELAFCRHHFRQHMVALVTSGWQQTDLSGR